jgi:hypothetical protein
VAILNRRAVVLLALVCFGLDPVPASAQRAAPISEPQAKAALLYNLPAFVEWPADRGDGVVIGIVGAPEVADALTSLVKRETPGRIDVRPMSERDDPAGVHMVFVSSDHEVASAMLLRHAAERSILTVGDAEGFTRRGGIIGVYFEGTRIRFEISLRNATRAHLRISSKLLSLATVVDKGTND